MSRRCETLRNWGFCALGCFGILVGLSDRADASATIDLIWADSGTPTTSAVSTTVVLEVILTAGPNGSAGAGVSVDYSAAVETLSVIGYSSAPSGELPYRLGSTTDSGTQINNINSHCPTVTSVCYGILEGQSHLLGTVQFHNSGVAGIFTLPAVIVGSDGVLDRDFRDISDTTTLRPAFVSNLPEPSGPSFLVVALAALGLFSGRSRR